MVTNLGATRDQRCVIETVLPIGDQSWPIEITLANRDQMGLRMLLGRTSNKGRFLVNPGKSFCVKKLLLKDNHVPNVPPRFTQGEE